MKSYALCLLSIYTLLIHVLCKLLEPIAVAKSAAAKSAAAKSAAAKSAAAKSAVIESLHVLRLQDSVPRESLEPVAPVRPSKSSNMPVKVKPAPADEYADAIRADPRFAQYGRLFKTCATCPAHVPRFGPICARFVRCPCA